MIHVTQVRKKTNRCLHMFITANTKYIILKSHLIFSWLFFGEKKTKSNVKYHIFRSCTIQIMCMQDDNVNTIDKFLNKQSHWQVSHLDQ